MFEWISRCIYLQFQYNFTTHVSKRKSLHQDPILRVIIYKFRSIKSLLKSWKIRTRQKEKEFVSDSTSVLVAITSQYHAGLIKVYDLIRTIRWNYIYGIQIRNKSYTFHSQKREQRHYWLIRMHNDSCEN